MTERALVVLSGGQDSTTCLFWAIKRYGPENVEAVTFDYGQRHIREIQAARDIAELANVPQETVKVGPILNGTSPLTNAHEQLEKYTDYASMDKIIGDRVEKTFVPMRNALFLTLAANRAFCGKFTRIVTGVCQADNANYPDCRAEFIGLQEQTINEALGTSPYLGAGGDWIQIDTPLMNLSKADSIRLALEVGAYPALAYSHTAYDGNYPPVGNDHASVLRAHGFEEAGVPDPLVIRAYLEGVMQVPETPNYSAVSVKTVIMALQEFFIPRRGVGWYLGL